MDKNSTIPHFFSCILSAEFIDKKKAATTVTAYP
jgi:hypothetical protein